MIAFVEKNKVSDAIKKSADHTTNWNYIMAVLVNCPDIEYGRVEEKFFTHLNAMSRNGLVPFYYANYGIFSAPDEPFLQPVS